AETTLTFFVLLFLEGAKQPWYLIYFVPLFSVSLAACLNDLWIGTARPWFRVAACGFLCLQLGYPALVIAQNKYGKTYLPLISALAARAPAARSVMGPAELGFWIGFDKVLDDFRLGYYSHKQPEFIVLDPRYRSYIEECRERDPQVSRYVDHL